jgi:hypothetical protein
MKSIIIFSILLLFITIQGNGNITPPVLGLDTIQLNKLKNRAYGDGELLRYKAYYTSSLLYLPAGEVSFKTKLEKFNSKTCWHLIGTGQTYKSYDWFFRVRDVYESYVDTTTMLPLKFLRDVHEGSYKLYHNVSFKHDQKTAISTKGVFKVPYGIQDILSAVYSIRNIDYSALKVGDKIPFNIFLDDEIWPIYIKYIGKQQIVTKVGTINCIKFVPFLIKGTMFKGGEGMTIWISDDKNRIPIRIESEVSVGSVRADLISYLSLRNTFTSKVK